MTEPAVVDELLDTVDTAEALGLSRAMVTYYARSGELPVAHRLNGKRGALLFRRSDVEAFRDRQVK